MPSIFFGDLHNHNALGYGKGSLQRSFEIAREHLDFFAFTGHSSWHDMARMEEGREAIWERGFDTLRAAWSDVVRLTAETNKNSNFVSFLGFEWHSSRFGDHCVIFPGNEGEIAYPDHVDDLRSFCMDRGALMIPHHLAYPTGHRGVNWDVFDPVCTPFVEIYSEHGNSEEDRGSFPFFSHSLGGRVTANTVRTALAKGLRFGFSAGSDNHQGFPGAYGEGVMAVVADRLSRDALLDAMWARRVYATTGERIEVNLHVNELPMGSETQAHGVAQVAYEVRARDEIDVVEIIQDGSIARRVYPESGSGIDGTLQIRVEWGWGPWQDLDLERIADWNFTIHVDNGRILRVFPCFQSGPFDEDRRHRIHRIDDSAIRVTSYTGRRGAYRGNPNQSIVIEFDGPEYARLTVDTIQPRRTSAKDTISDLLQGGQMVFTGPFPAEAMLIHRPVVEAESLVAGMIDLPVPDAPSYLYLRVRQKNGQMAWTSPVFLNY